MSLTEHTESTERREKVKNMVVDFCVTQKSTTTVLFCESQSICGNRREPSRCGRNFFEFGKKLPANSLPSCSSLSVLSVNSSETCERVRAIRNHAGFSLIEVLVSMTVLVVIIVMVTNMFRNASEAWDMGTQRAEMNTSARAAIEYITRELSCAVAGSIPDSAGNPLYVKRFKLEKDAADNVQNLSFIALSGDDQALRGIRFRYDQSGGHFIETCRKTSSDFYRYDNLNWDSGPNDNWQGVAPLITNVWRFQVIAYAKENDINAGNSSPSYDSEDLANNHSLPACVDISIEMLGEQNMARALTPGWSVAQQNGFVMTNSRVYTTRVCFPNRGNR